LLKILEVTFRHNDNIIGLNPFIHVNLFKQLLIAVK
jgi:hypothetical protein